MNISSHHGYIYKKYDIIEIFDKNYYKILKDVKTQKELDEKYQYALLIEKAKETKEEEEARR